MQSHEYTSTEIRKQFLTTIAQLAKYWSKTEVPVEADIQSDLEEAQYRLTGLAFSILNILDGTSAALPGFIVAPRPHEDDKQYHLDEESDYYPENHEVEDLLKGKLHGDDDSVLLHELWHDVIHKMGMK